MRSWRQNHIMSKVRQMAEEDPEEPETIPNLVCTEVMPMSPNTSDSFVENSDLSDSDLRNDRILQLGRKKVVEFEPINSDRTNSDTGSEPRITPVMRNKSRISPRKSCTIPSASTDYFSDNEDNDLPKDFDSDDSVRDKTYCVNEELDTTDLDSSNEENDMIKERKTNNEKIKLQNQTKCDKRDEIEVNIQNSEDQKDQQTNTQEIRLETETITCGFQKTITEKEIVQGTDNNRTNNEERQATSIIQKNDTIENETVSSTLTKTDAIDEWKIIHTEGEGNTQDSGDQIDYPTNTQEIRVETEGATSSLQLAITETVQGTDNNRTNNEERQATSIIQKNDTIENETVSSTVTKTDAIDEWKIIRTEGEGNTQDSGDQIDYPTNTQEIRVETEAATSSLQLPITEKEMLQETENIRNIEERQATLTIQRDDDAVNEGGNISLTKKGTIRKRKIVNTSTAERQAKKKQDMIEKLSLKKPCEPTCKKLCTKNISMEQRQVINSRYTALDTAGKGMFIKNNVSVANVQSRKNINKEPKRNLTFNYFFTVRGHERPVQVCKIFFLATLGYNPKNDTKVFRVLHTNEDDNLKEKRGHYDRSALSKDKTLITSHIMTFNPAISHYRREHAPLRLYLPSDITIAMMHADFNKKYPESSCSYEVYRRVVKSLNISFAVLGNEECEMCAVYELHTCEFNKAPNTSCATCNDHVEHRQRYRDSRKAYKSDKKNVENHKDDGTIYVCVDLQKVVMLPRMDSYKVAIFCPRIIAFNETFAPLGKSTKANNPYAVLWHEAISGRNVHDIVSTFRAFLLHHRNKRDLVIWADNCSSQNKNWTLFSFLVNIVNSDLIEARSITIKYLEPGHTFNSADSFHHQVEQSLQKMKNVCDFSDFAEAVRTSNSGLNIPKLMDFRDFYKYCDFHSEQKMRAMKDRVYVKNLTVIKFVRGEYFLFYKKSHADEVFTALNFLQAKIIKNKQFPCPEQRTSPRGIASSRKERIVKDLVPLMFPSRRQFWFDLPTDNTSLDLSKDLDD